jgi:UTP--glucose-1-phosphate uridylyltransferase
VNIEDVVKYGIVSGTNISHDLMKVNSLVEKPSVENSPSNIAIIGRYVLKPMIFDSLKSLSPGKDNEIQLTDALIDVLNNGNNMLARELHGRRFDVGTVFSYISANIELALLDDRFSSQMKALLFDLYARTSRAHDN